MTMTKDKLQEEVAETIEKLGRAGITTWMVTGDKKETAVNLGHASGKNTLQASSNGISFEPSSYDYYIVIVNLFSFQNRHATIQWWASKNCRPL